MTGRGPYLRIRTSHGFGGSPQPLPESILERILSVEVLDSDLGMDEITVTFDNADLALWGQAMSRAALAFNTRWHIQFGWEGGTLSPIRAFLVKSLKGNRTLTMRAYGGAAVRLDYPARHVVFRNSGGDGKITRSQVARQIALEAGLVVETGAIQTTFGDFESITQHGISDGAMLTKMADDLGFVWWAKDFGDDRAYFFFGQREMDKRADRRIDLGDEGVVGEPEIEVDVFQIPNTAISLTIDPLNNVLKEHEGSNDATERAVSGSSTPISKDIAGQNTVEPHEGGTIPSLPAMSEKRLEEEIDGLFKKVEENLIRIRLTVVGDPSIAVGHTLELVGFGQALDSSPQSPGGGNYYVSEARHRIRQGGGFLTELSLMRNALGDFDVPAKRDRLRARVASERRAAQGGVTTPSAPGVPPVAVADRTLGTSPDAESVKVPVRAVGFSTGSTGQ